MKQKIARLKKIASVYRARTEKEQHKYQQAQKKLTTHETQLVQLHEYQRDYQNRIIQEGMNGLNARSFCEQHQFIAKVQESIMMQQNRISYIQHEVTACFNQWNKAKQKEELLEKLLQRYQLEQNKRLDKKEQASNDEQNIRLFNQR